MRIAALELAPYGHVANVRLEFRAPDGGPGLMSQRAATAPASPRRAAGARRRPVRYTAPHTRHTHPPRARAEGRCEPGRTRRPDAQRRATQKRTQSLSAFDGTVVEEALLREFLGGLPPEEFRAMFLLDCEKLKKGSEDLVAGRGLLGEALFGAALGLGQVHKVLAELDAEADALWVKGGQKVLNRQLKALGEARKAVRAGRLAPDAWVAMRRELQEAEEELVTVRDGLRQHTETAIRSERHERCLAPLGRRRLTLERLAELPAVAEVPASLPQEARDSVNTLKKAEQDAREAREELQAVELKLDENPAPGVIAENEDAVNALYKRAGEISKATTDLPRREAELDAHEQEIRVLLARARPGGDAGEVEALRVSDAERALVDEYASERPALDRVQTDATNAVDRLKRRIEKHREVAPPAASMTAAAHDALATIVDAASDAGDLDSAVRDGHEQVTALQAAAERGNAAMTHWNGTVLELERLKVPSAATIERFVKQFMALERAGERLDERDVQVTERARLLAEEDARLKDGPAAPLRSEVSAARRVRDDALNTLIENPSPRERDADVLHDAVRGADELADSRADHGEAAAAREHLERDRTALADTSKQIRLEHEAHAKDAADVHAKWAKAWGEAPVRSRHRGGDAALDRGSRDDPRQSCRRPRTRRRRGAQRTGRADARLGNGGR